MGELIEGMPAPDFALPTGDGRTVTLSEMRGSRVVLYFYPKDDTSGCTREACDFRDNLGRLSGLGAVVIGVSPDTPASHVRFAAKHGLNFTLLADEGSKVATAYGVWVQKSMYGRQYMGIERSTFVIDSEGVLRSIFRKVKVAGHVDEVIEAVQKVS